MSTKSRSRVGKSLRKAGVGGAVFLVAAATATAGAGVANANATFSFDRILDQSVVSPDRYGTSVATATQFGASPTVILASGTPGHTVDALGATYLAGMKKAPILATELDRTPPKVAAYLASSGVTNIIIVGGTSAVSAAQEAALATKYTVTRVDGTAFANPDRYATTAQVIVNGGKAKTDTALVASGNDKSFADALGAGVLSYAKGLPLALVAKGELPESTLTALQDAGITKVLIVGGVGAVGQAVSDALVTNGISVSTPFQGDDRAETSALVADYEIANYGFSNTAVNVASGYFAGGGADALGGTALSAKENRPLLITKNVDQGGKGVNLDFVNGPRAEEAGFLEEHAPTLATGHIFGGIGAVSNAAQASLTEAARTTPASNQTLAVTPGTPQTAAQGNSAQFSVTGLDNAKTYGVALFNCDNVQTDDGQTTFAQTGGSGNAVPGALGKNTLSQVNGINTAANTTKTAVMPSNGGISVTVANGDTTGAAQSCVVPVVFEDDNNDGILNVDAITGAPTEAFGTGGTATFTAPAAATDTFTGATVDSADTAAGTFTATTGGVTAVFNYTAAGSFYNYTTSTQLTLAQFAEYLGAGDVLDINYNANGPSTFTYTTDVPAAPTNVTAAYTAATVTPATSASVTVDFTGVSNPDVNGYFVQQAPVTGGGVGTFANVGSFATTDGPTVVPAPGPGTYVYQVIATATGTDGPPSATSNQVTVPNAPAEAAPQITTVAVTTGLGGGAGEIAVTYQNVLVNTVECAANAGANFVYSNSAGTVQNVRGNGCIDANNTLTITFPDVVGLAAVNIGAPATGDTLTYTQPTPLQTTGNAVYSNGLTAPVFAPTQTLTYDGASFK